jgi:hypothetical protein
VPVGWHVGPKCLHCDGDTVSPCRLLSVLQPLRHAGGVPACKLAVGCAALLLHGGFLRLFWFGALSLMPLVGGQGFHVGEVEVSDRQSRLALEHAVLPRAMYCQFLKGLYATVICGVLYDYGVLVVATCVKA